MFILASKYDLVDFVAFSGDSQNTDCCCMGNFLSFLSVLLGRKATFVIHTIRVDPLFVTFRFVDSTFLLESETRFFLLPFSKDLTSGHETKVFGR